MFQLPHKTPLWTPSTKNQVLRSPELTQELKTKEEAEGLVLEKIMM